MSERFPAHAIAIVGMAGRFPGADTLDAFWKNIREGIESRESFSEADLDAAGIPPALRADPRYVRAGAVLQEAESFDAAFFGITPREAQVMDPQQRVFLECAWHALEDAGHTGVEPGVGVGVYAGAGFNTYLTSQIMQDYELMVAAGGYQLMIGNDKDFLCTRASYKLDLRGPSITVQTACSTSLVAVVLACRALARGECDLALAGGVSIGFPQRAGYLFQEGMILSPDGHCRPFDAAAAGTRPSSGCGVVVLKRLDEALRDGDTIRAVIRGAAINNDGAAKAGYTAPGIDGQVEVIATALALSGVDARSIGYLEAHGTGTPLGDPIEIAALTHVFRESTSDVAFCRLGSLKAMLGHLDTAAGVAGLIKAVLVLQNRELPPLIHFQSPNPQLGLPSSPFSAQASAESWASDGAPRRAGVSSFGIGGTNAHVVLEEAPSTSQGEKARAPAHLLTLSAKTPAALDRMTANLAAHLSGHPELNLADVEYTLQVGRRAFEHRRIIAARDTNHAIELLKQPQSAAVPSGAHDGGTRKVAFLFSGQGSQHAGMGAGLYATERVYRDVVDKCAAILTPLLGIDIRSLMHGEAADTALINETRITQPALFVCEVALAALWQSWGVKPSAMLGHSIGEYVAAHLAGVLSREDALHVVAARGRLMQALPAGSMAAVHLGAAQLKPRLIADVEIAAVNAPELCVVSGPREAVAAQIAALQASGIDARLLHTSHAFHSRMMEPALAEFGAVLKRAQLSPPSIPYVSNLTGTWIDASQATDPQYYVKHLRNAVLFEAGVRTLAADRSLLLLETGPGNALTTLARLTVGRDGLKRVVQSLGRAQETRNDPLSLREAAGRLWMQGVALDFAGLHAGAPRSRVPLPGYPFDRIRYSTSRSASPATTASAAQTTREGWQPVTTLEDWFYSHSWARDESTIDGAPALSGTWLIAGQASALRSELAARVDACGGTAVVVDGAEAIAAKLTGLSAATTLAGVFHLAIESRSSAAAHFDEFLSIAASLERHASEHGARLIHVTSGAHSVLGERATDSAASVAAGVAIVLPTEIAGLRVTTVDLQAGEGNNAAALVEEAAVTDTATASAWRAGCRWVRRLERIPLPPAAEELLPLKKGGVYLITGGTGGMGLTFARWLAQRFQARVVLTSRSSSLKSAVIAAIRDAEAEGGAVRVHAADAADEKAMRAAVDATLAEWGTIDGVIHAAGIAGTGTLAALKAPGEARAVLAPKIDGLNVLVRLLGGRSLDFVALMSSINSVVGAPGVTDYAAANAALDHFPGSSARPASWRRVVAINWGAWKDVGMAANLDVPAWRRAQWDAFLATAIDPASAMEAFTRVLASRRPRVVVASYDIIAQERDVARGATGAAAGAEDPVATAPTVAASSDDPSLPAEARVMRIWSELLGIDQLAADDDFFALGGHSLLATRVLARIQESFGVKLTLRDIFEGPTVRQTAARIEAMRPSSAPAAAEEREELEF